MQRIQGNLHFLYFKLLQYVKLSATRSNLQKDGLHFRQPWVLRVQEEVRSLRQKVDEMAAELAQLKELLTRK